MNKRKMLALAKDLLSAERLERIAKSAGTPKIKFDMSTWAAPVDDRNGNECGTACCIAGLAAIKSTGNVDNMIYNGNTKDIAQRDLELSDVEATLLFHGGIDEQHIESTNKLAAARAIVRMTRGLIPWERGCRKLSDVRELGSLLFHKDDPYYNQWKDKD